MAATIPPERMRVPLHRIPPFNPVCIKCHGAVRTVMSMPMADFYMRRHQCRNLDCRTTFYSKSYYGSDLREVQMQVPKDRALMPYEIAERKRWWQEDPETARQPQPYQPPVTTRGNEPAVLADIALALATAPSERSPLQQFISDMVDAIQQEIDASGDTGAVGVCDSVGETRGPVPAGSGADAPAEDGQLYPEGGQVGHAGDGVWREPARLEENELPLFAPRGVPV